jgi:hypothetical protein
MTVKVKKVCCITFLAIAVCLVFSSCKSGKKTDEDIIVEKVVAKPQAKPGQMERDERNGSVTWIDGAEYSYSILRHSDDSLAIVENHGKKYHDNAIRLSVYRSDGTVFFQKTFTKANFSPVLPEQFREHGVLLGMNLDKAEGNNLRFIVSVGSPDDSNEEFYYVVMKLNNFGTTSAERCEGMGEDD